MKSKNDTSGRFFAVIDTETTWSDAVMSIGIVIADCQTFEPVDKQYYIISPEYLSGGMYSYALIVKSQKTDLKDTRQKVIEHLLAFLQKYHVESVFAYNASFDYRHLPELQHLRWFDIIKIAAYKQYNKKIPSYADCWSTGRLKQDFGVEPMMKMLSHRRRYSEVHNAICDAVDELLIMKLLGLSYESYQIAQIGTDTAGQKKSHHKQTNCIQNDTLPDEKHQFEEGDKVFHAKLGNGVVMKTKPFEGESYIVTVEFENAGVREFISLRAERCLKFIE